MSRIKRIVHKNSHCTVHKNSHCTVHKDSHCTVHKNSHCTVHKNSHCTVHKNSHCTVHKNSHCAVHKNSHCAVHQNSHCAVHKNSHCTVHKNSHCTDLWPQCSGPMCPIWTSSLFSTTSTVLYSHSLNSAWFSLLTLLHHCNMQTIHTSQSPLTINRTVGSLP